VRGPGDATQVHGGPTSTYHRRKARGHYRALELTSDGLGGRGRQGKAGVELTGARAAAERRCGGGEDLAMKNFSA
jgi:hypothetical protein